MKVNIKKIMLVTICIVIGIALMIVLRNKDRVTNTENNMSNNLLEENIGTTEIPNMTFADEEMLEFQETESESFELQGNEAYEGTKEVFDSIAVGKKVGLTYYSQIDSRWKNIMYSSRGDKNQTIGSSGCGPTAAAIVVTSIRGVITPDKMAEMYVKYRI